MPGPPPEVGPRALYVLRIGDDDPRRCTGLRLLRRRLAGPWPPVRDGPSGVLLLDPHASEPLSRADAGGPPAILAVDCSWNGLAGRRPAGWPSGRRSVARRLPILLAANPHHFGRPTELNTAEALGAALYLLGETDRAVALLAEFPGGRGFVPLNAAALAAYRDAPDAASVRRAERAGFAAPRAEGTPGPRSRDARSGPPPAPPAG